MGMGSAGLCCLTGNVEYPYPPFPQAAIVNAVNYNSMFKQHLLLNRILNIIVFYIILYIFI